MLDCRLVRFALGFVLGLGACDRAPAAAPVAGAAQAFQRGWPRLWHHHLPPPPSAACADAGTAPPPACGWQRYETGLSGADVGSLLYDPGVPGSVYAAVGGGVWQSLDSGDSWEQQGELPAGVSQFALGAEPGQLLAATDSGLWSSSDAGKNWSRLSFGGVVLARLGVAAVQPLRLFTNPAGSSGVFVSDDGGNSFQPVGGFGYPHGQALGLSVDPRDPQTLVAAVRAIGETGGFIDDGSIVRSSDAGLTWQTVLSGQGWLGSLERCGADPNVLLAGTQRGVAQSRDNGRSWNVLPLDGPQNGVVGTAIAPETCDQFYALQAQVGPRYSSDGGHSFGPALVSGLQVLPEGSFPGMMMIDPNDATRLLLATHGGLYASRDAGSNWSLVPGLLHMAVYSLTSSPRDPMRAWLASWGSGVWTRASPSAEWQRIPLSNLPADYATLVAADPFSASRLIVGAAGKLYLSHDGAQFDEVLASSHGAAVAFDPRDARVLYAATEAYGIFKSSDGGASWAESNGQLQPFPTSSGTFLDVRALVFDAISGQRLLAGMNGNGIWASDDAAASWRNVMAPGQAVVCLLAVPAGGAVPAGTYACARGVQYSGDGGETWSAASEGLPSLQVRALALDPSGAALYATTPRDVFVKRGAEPWVALDSGCAVGAGPATIVRGDGQDFLVVAAAGGLRAHAL
jgi:hypothetical protein